MRKLTGSPVFRKAVTALSCVAGAHLLSALTLDRMLQYKEITYRSKRIVPSLDGYTIAFLTDIHGYPEAGLTKMAGRVSARGVDLVLLGGDFSGQRDLSRCMEILAGIGPPDGIYGVEGNHDSAARLKAVMKAHGMVLLENEGVPIREGLYIAGLEDHWNRFSDAETAASGAGGGDFVLFLCHNPDAAMRQDFSAADLTLSGHTHGGELSLFGLWSPVMPIVSRYGQTYRSGWCKSAAGTDLYVSNGIGRHSPMRVFVRPQVIYLTLRHIA